MNYRFLTRLYLAIATAIAGCATINILHEHDAALLSLAIGEYVVAAWSAVTAVLCRRSGRARAESGIEAGR